MNDTTFSKKSPIFCAMPKETWRDRLLQAIEKSGKTNRQVSLAARRSPNYAHQIIYNGKEPTLKNLMAMIEQTGASSVWVIQGLDLDGDAERLLKIFLELRPDQRTAMLQWAEAFRPRR